MLVGADGRPRILDFGLVRGHEEDETLEGAGDSINQSLLSQELTMVGQFVGTPAYMSPEQFLGAEVDARSDQYSFFLTQETKAST